MAKRGARKKIPTADDAHEAVGVNRNTKAANTKGRTNVTPKDTEAIAALWLKGYTMAAIAAATGVARTSVYYHVSNVLVPEFRTSILSERETELAKIDHLEMVAWQRFESTAPAEIVEQVKSAIPEISEASKSTEKLDDAKLAIIERTLRKVTRAGQSAWLDVVKWCIEQRCKIMGHYAAQRLDLSVHGELRVAGLDPEQIDQIMLQRLAEVIEARDRTRALMGGGSGGSN